MERTDYEKQAEDFLNNYGLTLQAAFKGDKCPPWDDEKHIHGDRYRVTIKRKVWTHTRLDSHGEVRPNSVSFDFWNSYRDSGEGKTPTVYDVLSCISGDVYCADTFEDFCSEFGYDIDSRKAEQTYRRCKILASKLSRFFTDIEIRDLQEIQ